MNRSLQLVLAATTALSAAACAKDSSPIKTSSATDTTMSSPADSTKARGQSQVRVVNAVNGGKDVAVQLAEMQLFSDVKAGTVTAYKPIETNAAQFTVRLPGAPDGLLLAEKDRLLMDGNRYTIFVIAQDVSKSTLRVVKDDVVPDSGKARIRVVHAAPGGPALDIKVVGAEGMLFSDVGFTSGADYQDVTPSLATIEVRAKGQTPVLLTIPKVDLKRGTATTIVITGASKLGFFTFTDALMAQTPKT